MMEEQLLKIRNIVASIDPNLYMTSFDYRPTTYIFANRDLNTTINYLDFRRLLKKSLQLLHPKFKSGFNWIVVEEELSQRQIIEIFDIAIEYNRLGIFE